MRTRFIQILAVPAVAAWLALLAAGAPAATAQEFQVIVHEDRSTDSMSRKEVSRLFLRQITRWDDGPQVVPLDQAKDSAVREAFLRKIHDKDETDYAKYWVRLVFTGRGQPPDEIQGDAGVLGAVASNRAAIGYVSGDAELPKGVKAIEVTE